MQENENPEPTEAICCCDSENKQVSEESHVSIDYFSKIELKVGQILEAENLPKSEKLLKMKVDLGENGRIRQILAGIAKYYKPEDLIGRKVVVVANLKPAKIMGHLSEGMLLCASNDKDYLELLSPGVIVSPGSIVR